MASLLSPALNIPLNKVDSVNTKALASKAPGKRGYLFVRPATRRRGQFLIIRNKTSLEADLPPVEAVNDKIDYGVVGVHHVGILCENLERSLHFYQNILGLEINEARPHDKLPYRGAWLWVGSEMIHLMELPNPDPLLGRPEHGGRDRHSCIAILDVSKLKSIFDREGIPYTLSRSGRPAIFTRDPDANALEFTQVN
ncbi:uncharacterized protein [Primulina huaijiensis]|uniref:uncharacterized protein n=1 Tax=Primulina huaijiensis TaxID=1492673 RepID=UPI003CC75D58